MPRVLIATDGSDFAIATARRALELLADPGSVVLLTVVPPAPVNAAAPMVVVDGVASPQSPPERSQETERALADAAEAALDRTGAALGLDADRRVAWGDPAREICRMAEEADADVVVIGSRGSDWMDRLMQGSISEQVLHHIRRPLLVVRQP